MNVKCDYCNNFFDDQEENCPHCGAPNAHIRRTTHETPKTIEELKNYCEQNGFTSERTRFFIGEDYRGARAFGIYEEAGRFIVYKNKADGKRAVRYEGTDEAYAVNEIYQRLQSEILNQKGNYLNKQENNLRSSSRGIQKKKRRLNVFTIILIVFAVQIVLSSLFSFISRRHNGYYSYQGNHYYNLSGSWYYWDDYDWAPVTSYDLPDDFSSNYEDYYEGHSYDSAAGISDFTDTDYYSDWEESNRSSSYDDSGWSSSDWDSGSTDWDSDW